MGVNPIPEGYHSVTPYLIVEGAAELLDFVKSAFGAEERFRMPAPNGTIGHAEVKIGDSIVMVADAGDEWPAMPAYRLPLRRRHRRDVSARARRRRDLREGARRPVLRRPQRDRPRLGRQ